MTFLFTDIEGSTRLWEQYPEAMRDALVRHDSLVSASIQGHEGRVVKSRGEGDSFFAVFARATDAVAAAVALQHALVAEPWPRDLRLCARVALHTGEAELLDGDYLGSVVNRCARLRAIAHGGQVLLSRTTFDLVRDALPEATSLLDLGEQRLRDLTRPEHIFQLLHPDLPREFPPLATLDLHSHNLPVQATPLLGREKEVTVMRELLCGDVRLLTLTGPGGTGKTRLGLQVAADLIDLFANGVFFVDLAPITDPELVASTIAQTIGMRVTPGQSLLEGLKAHLREKHLLLLLDNFEQILAAAPLVAALMATAPGLTVLVTSRCLLRLRGEHEFPVPPLALPDRKHRMPIEALSQYSAVALFIQRAIAARADFTVTNDENAPAVAEICRRLDGLPLAIELAAARVKLFQPQVLLSRLGSRMKLLTGGARDLPARQQTLRAAIAWSYDLLHAGEKKLFRRLSVFVGGCTLEAVEAICNVDADLDVDVFNGIASLMDQSLLQAEEAGGEPRFTMLETIREYGLECLAETEEEEAIRRTHANFHALRAEAARAEGLQDWLQAETDNLRAALKWSANTGGGLTFRLAQALEWCEGDVIGVIPLDSALYLSRRHDEEVREAISRRDSLILLKGARQTGKSSLLLRCLELAREAGARVVTVDLQELADSQLESAGTFLFTLWECIRSQLELHFSADESWSSDASAGDKFQEYLRREVLEVAEAPVVLGLDETQRLFSRDFASQVHDLFCSWHAKRALDPTGPWSRLTLVIGMHTEYEGDPFDTDPVPVGTRLELEDFTLDEVRELNRRHGSPLKTATELQRFYGLVGGHPYLVHRGLYELATGGSDIEEFESQADQDSGIYAAHLLRILIALARNPALDLYEAMRRVLQGQPCPTSESFYLLRSGGVLAGTSPYDARPRSQLYASFLRRHLL